MAGVSVAAEWQLQHESYYRKLKIYSMQWQVDFSRNKIACAPFGGPIAVIRDDAKIVQLLAESAIRKLNIYNSAGILLSSTRWDRPGGRLIGMSWTDDQTLVCVIQEPNISLGLEQNVVVECVFWGNGMVCLTEGYQIFCISDFRNPNPCKLETPLLEDYPLCIAVIEPQHTASGNVEVLLGVNDYILVVDEDGGNIQKVAEGIGPLQKMVLTQNGKFLASFTHDGRILVTSTANYKKILFEYECESALPPEQFSWCGMRSVLLYWDDMLLVVGPFGDPVRYLYDDHDPIILIPECDGVRVLSSTSMEFLQLVRESTVSIFSVGSTKPAALLYDALNLFDRRSAKADDYLRSVRSELPEAVEACIDAAGHEFDVSRQQTLLRAASYGKSFCSHVDRFREMCTILRVLNAVRNYEIGIPLTIQQYKLQTVPVLIGRLINAHQHLLALRGCNAPLGVCKNKKKSPAVDDAALLEMLLDKLKLCKGISYPAVATQADKSGRRKLAATLVEHEPRLSKQVPLLLSIGEDDTALMKATESGDTDLVYLALFHIWQKSPPLEFFGTLQARPLARDLFITYARCYKHEFLKNFFLSTGRLQDAALLLWKESWELGKNPIAIRRSALHGPHIKLIEKTHSLFAGTKEHTFESKAAEEHARLLRIQHELEVSTKQTIYVDSSVSDTIRTCIALGNHQVSKKRWYWLEAFALARKRDWGALEKFCKEKRPSIGYRPFVDACIDANEKSEALKYIPKLRDPTERAKSYARIGMAKEAENAATQSKDGKLLGRLKLTFAQNATASSIFDTLRDRLGVS
ncbi:hypothetical protein MKW98_029499 [Papaver atlanticum]|uniref:Protein VACUOLELESS1 n=1 Tax=Papaver atlanticum TaxID=357466 RepID=A0AAD4SI15_9MAGN|nr:hypothetical protein MKW98_029499 [Papaver atlanticum]